MRIIGLLSWFDEDPNDLVRMVTSFADAGLMDALVAVDGRYALYDRGGPCVSERTQHAAITAACETRGVDLTLVRRETPWAGEVEKRNALFRHGMADAECGTDWLWVIDADYELAEHPGADRVRAALSVCENDVAEVVLGTFDKNEVVTYQALRQLYRARPGFSVVGRHSYYVARIGEKWRYLWDPVYKAVPALPMDDVVVLHHQAHRERARQRKAADYYAERDLIDAEHEPGRLVTGEDGYPVEMW